MKKNYPIISLYVSLAAFIALALTLLTRGAMALGIFTPAKPETIDLALLISGALVILGLAVYAILAPDSVRIFLGGRQARYGSNALVMVLAFTGIVLVTNYLAFKNPKTLVDMTEDKSNTLAPEMAKTLQELPSKMTAVGYFSPEIQRDQAEQLLSNMKNKSQGNFDYRFADPVANPVQAKSDGVTGDGKIVLEMSGRKEIADYADQTELLRAMNRLLNPEARAVYFLAGHGELNIEESGQTGLSRASETLT
ncbi:MAG: Gldg family protein, partial [Anaerolineales bacterium]|nr:Gldg family protein [Anaerolineales bacterium]